MWFSPSFFRSPIFLSSLPVLSIKISMSLLHIVIRLENKLSLLLIVSARLTISLDFPLIC
jgi:hypothetical protein